MTVRTQVIKLEAAISRLDAIARDIDEMPVDPALTEARQHIDKAKALLRRQARVLHAGIQAG